MKERSLPNQYLMLEAIKSRFDAREVKTGMERARELLAGRAELTEGDGARAAENVTDGLTVGTASSPTSPSVSFDQEELWAA